MTNEKKDIERLATLEANMSNIDARLKGLESSMGQLHGKFDLLTQNYVAKETFEEYKKNKWLERIVTVLITAIISGLIAFFLREANV